MKDAKEQLTPDLDLIERRVVAPSTDLLGILEGVRKLFIKRNHKLLDYDRKRNDAKKLQDRKDRDAGDEKRLAKLEADLDQATRDYESVNNLLKTQLPMLFQFRIQFIDPCFQTFYLYQLKVFYTLQTCFKAVVDEHFDMRSSITADYDAKRSTVDDLFNELTLVQRASRSSVSSDPDAAANDDSLPAYDAPQNSHDNPRSPPIAVGIPQPAPYSPYRPPQQPQPPQAQPPQAQPPQAQTPFQKSPPQQQQQAFSYAPPPQKSFSPPPQKPFATPPPKPSAPKPGTYTPIPLLSSTNPKTRKSQGFNLL